MPGYDVPLRVLKDKNRLHLDRYLCSKCELLLRDPVLPHCGHKLCNSCADGLPAPARCPRQDCKKNFVQENGEMYQPDDFAEQEIRNLKVICPYSEAGCKWEGKFYEYYQHKENCDTQVDLPSYKHGNVHPFYSIQSFDEQHVQPYEQEDRQKLLHSEEEQYPTNSSFSSPNAESYMENRYEHERHFHMQESDHSIAEYSHLSMIVNSRQLLRGETVPVPASDHEVDMTVVINAQEFNIDLQRFQVPENQAIQSSSASFTMQQLDDEIASLDYRVAKLNEKIQLLNIKLKEHDFRLSQIENSDHDGTMIWKIPQFSQRKAETENGKNSLLYSPSFYSGRYGYKMCLCLYIMGDGIGKGTHLSLFFVVMYGEFDNFLQWPFTHKVTFKLINQAGGRDIVDTFQPDPTNSSFRKPTSDMNIAIGRPRFVSHIELEQGGFIVDDIIFIKCTIDTSTICHP